LYHILIPSLLFSFCQAIKYGFYHIHRQIRNFYGSRSSACCKELSQACRFHAILFLSAHFAKYQAHFRKNLLIFHNDFICEGRNSKAMSKRTEELKIRISPEDKERIKLKMEDAGILNMSAYVRKMALDGICIRLDLKDVRQLTVMLR